MKPTFNNFILFTISLICLSGCYDKQTAPLSSDHQMEVWADTIIYEVLISNPDSLNEWENTKVKHVRHQKLVDDLFTMIYNGEKKAYDYYSHQALSINDVKDIEASQGFSREKVGKLQFTETWSFDQEIKKLNKKTHSILLAYELYDASNNLRGYKAAFYIKDF